MKTLIFEGAGMEFRDDDKKLSDVGNYRIRTCFVNKNGNKIYLEIGRGNHYIYHKNGKKPLIDNHFYLYIDIAHYVTDGGNDANENRIDIPNPDLPYSKNAIVLWINSNFNCDFDDMDVTTYFDDYRVFGDGRGEILVQPGYIDKDMRNRRIKVFNAVDKKYKEHCKTKYSVIGITCTGNGVMHIRCHASDYVLGDCPRDIDVEY